jgi:hypothetical protein
MLLASPLVAQKIAQVVQRSHKSRHGSAQIATTHHGVMGERPWFAELLPYRTAC